PYRPLGANPILLVQQVPVGALRARLPARHVARHRPSGAGGRTGWTVTSNVTTSSQRSSLVFQMAETQTTGTAVTTPDGRTVLVHEAGDPAGRPLVVHHGSPSGGLFTEKDHDNAVERGMRLIGFDRAGYGGSDRNPGRTVGDVAIDVTAIADALGVERFATWG